MLLALRDDLSPQVDECEALILPEDHLAECWFVEDVLEPREGIADLRISKHCLLKVAVVLAEMPPVEHPVGLHLQTLWRAYKLEEATSSQFQELEWVYRDLLWREQREELPRDEVSSKHEAPVLGLQRQVV